jgi:uncharacterized membrane protein YesL
MAKKERKNTKKSEKKLKKRILKTYKKNVSESIKYSTYSLIAFIVFYSLKIITKSSQIEIFLSLLMILSGFLFVAFLLYFLTIYFIKNIK